MLRTARLTLLVKVCATSLMLNLICAAGHAQEISPNIHPQALAGVPFSAIGTAQIIRRTVDGNRFAHTSTTHFYRDGQGRIRVERNFDPPLMSDSNGARSFSVISIDDRVSGDLYFLQPANKTAQVIKRGTPGTANLAEGSTSPPPITASFENMMIGPTDRGWSEPVSLGEKSFDGINAIGSRRVYTLAAGAMHNDNAVTITIEQWYSPSLGAVLLKSSKASTGGEYVYKLDQIVQAEPDASLFTVPSDYQRIAMPANGTVISGNSAIATTTATEAAPK